MTILDVMLSSELIKELLPYTHSGWYSNTEDVFTRLFKPDAPIKQVFSHAEDDYQGEFGVLYEYKTKYLFYTGSYGSCGGCDEYADCKEIDMEKVLSRFDIFENLNDMKRVVQDIEYKSGIDKLCLKSIDDLINN